MTGGGEVVWGVSALSHDAALAVAASGTVLFAAHSERYSRLKNDASLHPALVDAALSAGGPPDRIVWYERPLLKKLRHVRAGQWKHAVNRQDLPGAHLRRLLHQVPRVEFVGHHDSHIGAGVATSGFDDCAVIVADAIGEFRTFTIGHRPGGERLRVLSRLSYPHSLGLLYSAFTRRCGFKPNEDEYVVMGMSAYGEPLHVDAIHDELLERCGPLFRLRVNPHRGIGHWLPDARPEDLAASIQAVTEDVMVRAARHAHEATRSRNLVLAGGVALNCAANSRIAAESGFESVHVFPNPGDAGSAVGAIAAATDEPLHWPGPYLGHQIAGEWPVDAVLARLLAGDPVGVASGKAEFGPRALGNRSLLADPRQPDVQNTVNKIKGREPFRPFAPVVREERFHDVFDSPVAATPYMQFTVRCKNPRAYPGIAHVDGTSRVQTVSRVGHPGLYDLLLSWEDATGCPVVLNTSLNVRGEPLVNTRQDAERFSRSTGVEVLGC